MDKLEERETGCRWEVKERALSEYSSPWGPGSRDVQSEETARVRKQKEEQRTFLRTCQQLQLVTFSLRSFSRCASGETLPVTCSQSPCFCPSLLVLGYRVQTTLLTHWLFVAHPQSRANLIPSQLLILCWLPPRKATQGVGTVARYLLPTEPARSRAPGFHSCKA